jgi:hypothetical protein
MLASLHRNRFEGTPSNRIRPGSVLRDAMGTDELATHMAVDAAMTQDQAVEYALSLNDHFRIGSVCSTLD